MKFFEEYYLDTISERLIKLREYYKLTQSDVGNASQISQIEKNKRPLTGSILYDFKQKTNSDYSDIIFGNLNKFIKDLFHYSFRSILFRDLRTVDNQLYSFYSEELVLIQANFLELAKTFTNYNIKRKNFIHSDNIEMDTFDKKNDKDIFVDGNYYNISRSFRNKPINEATVIDFEEMFHIIWLMLEDRSVNSFKINVCQILFELDDYDIPTKFRQENIDNIINKWLIQTVSQEIIFPLINKLKENPLFNIGYMVSEILEKMYKDSIPKSYLSSVPLVISKPKETCFISETTIEVPELYKEKINQIRNDYMKLLSQNKNIDELYKKHSKTKLKKLGIIIQESPSTNKVEERTFDEIIELVTSSFSTKPIQANSNVLQLEPMKFTDSDKSRIETIAADNDIDDFEIVDLMQIYDGGLDNTNVSRKVEGLLTNNSQIVYYFQEQLNEELLSMVDSLDKIQQAFICLLSDKEIKNYSM